MDSNKKEKYIKSAVINTTTILVGVAAKKGIEAIWKKTKNEEPPKNLEKQNVPFWKAASWITFAGVGAGLSKLVARTVSTKLLTK